MDWSLQAKSSATSPEYWSGWVLRRVHLALAENRPDVRKDNVHRLRSTTKWPAGRPSGPPDLTIPCPNFKLLSLCPPTPFYHYAPGGGGSVVPTQGQCA